MIFQLLHQRKPFVQSILTVHAVIKVKVTFEIKICFGKTPIRGENIIGKGENAGCQHFLLFSKAFLKAFFLCVVNRKQHSSHPLMQNL